MDQLRRDFDVIFDPGLWSDPDRLAREIVSALALIVRNQTQVKAPLIKLAENLKIVARAGVGLDNIDVPAASEAGIVVAYTPDENSVAVVELTIGLILALARKIVAANRDTRSGNWHRKAMTGTEIRGKTLGVVGFGRIGSLTAVAARGLGMQILAYDPYVDPGAEHVIRAGAKIVELKALLERSDMVSCHLPATDQTRGLFNAERFRQMKPASFFVNVARGEIVDEAALIDALQSGHLAGAALDVRQSEPPSHGPLNEMDQVILTPHVGGFTKEAQDRVVAAVCRDVLAVLDGKPARNAVNFSSPR